MKILGVNAYHGDVSAVLINDGELVAAVEEERFRRVKHWAGFPREAIRACLEIGGIAAREVDVFAVSRDASAHLWRKIWFALRARPSVGLVRDRLRNKGKIASLADVMASELDLPVAHVRARLRGVEHHPAHLASAFFVSPFDEAAVCAVDGFGDFVSTSMAVGRGSRIDLLQRTFFPHSLGLLYLALTQYLGFLKYGDEYKVMGLAPYGEPALASELRKLVRLEPGGRFSLALEYFRHWSDGVEMTWEEGEPTIGRVYTDALERLLGPARLPDEPVTERHEAIAASLQLVFEEAFFHVLNALHARTGLQRLCLAGGCAMNSVANGKIRSATPFEEIYIQPAAGDNGTALGAAYHVWHQLSGRVRSFTMTHAYYGTSFDSVCEPDDALIGWTAEQIAAGRVVGWFQGRMEWGARALGNRSILADPRRSDMRDILNAKIKLRETFRPFAPAILEERLDDYFEDAVADPFMVQVYPVRRDKRDQIPAVTHVDGSGRLQTVNRESNAPFWKLISAFEERTGVPVLLNTSFNENEPIVNTPEEAVACFERTGMDVLVIGDKVLEKQSTGVRPARVSASA